MVRVTLFISIQKTNNKKKEEEKKKIMFDDMTVLTNFMGILKMEGGSDDLQGAFF